MPRRRGDRAHARCCDRLCAHLPGCSLTPGLLSCPRQARLSSPHLRGHTQSPVKMLATAPGALSQCAYLARPVIQPPSRSRLCNASCNLPSWMPDTATYRGKPNQAPSVTGNTRQQQPTGTLTRKLEAWLQTLEQNNRQERKGMECARQGNKAITNEVAGNFLE